MRPAILTPHAVPRGLSAFFSLDHRRYSGLCIWARGRLRLSSYLPRSLQWPAYAAEHKLLHLQLRVKPRTSQTTGLTGFPNHRACHFQTVMTGDTMQLI